MQQLIRCWRLTAHLYAWRDVCNTMIRIQPTISPREHIQALAACKRLLC